jgi:NADH-quinone oxidoreductase subunit N
VVGAFYYIRIVKLAYFDEPTTQPLPNDSVVNGAIMGALAVFCSPIGMLAIAPLVSWTSAAAHTLLVG